MPKTRFFTWYRVAPLAVVFVFGLISLVYSYAPAAFFKPLYPILATKRSNCSTNIDMEMRTIQNIYERPNCRDERRG